MTARTPQEIKAEIVAQREGATKHVVGFSGGIDSQAVARWVLNRYPARDVILLNADAGGNEHPLTTEFVKWYSENVHPVTVVQAIVADLGNRCTEPGPANERRREFAETDLLTFPMLAYIKGLFPASQMQFCTEHLKLAPQLRWMKENIAGPYARYTGVRRDESKRRKETPFEQWDSFYGCQLFAPIADWTKEMCFDYVKAHGEKINELYTLGFDRVGCAPCVNSNKADILAWVQRFPEMIDKVRSWERETGLPFFAAGLVPRKEINWIDDVVRWSKTVRGGKQFGLHILEERPSCESMYGLCE